MDEDKDLGNENDNLCEFCRREPAKYTCPKCMYSYCCLDCYRSPKHISCTEEFYRECVMGELSSQTGHDKDDTKKIYDMLARNQQQYGEDFEENEENMLDSDDEEDSEDLASRMAGINLDDDPQKVWESLNDNERKEFQALIRNGDVTSFVTVWNPWWHFRDERKVQSMSETSQYVKSCPSIKTEIPPFESIMNKPPSPLVAHNTVNILASYALIVRYFNGEHNSSIRQASNAIAAFSGCFSQPPRNYNSFDLALEDVIYKSSITQNQIQFDASATSTLREDIYLILQGPDPLNQSYYLLAAFSDMLNLFRAAKKAIGKKSTELTNPRNSEFEKLFPEIENTIPQLTKERLNGIIKKLEYHLSWINQFSQLLCGQVHKITMNSMNINNPIESS